MPVLSMIIKKLNNLENMTSRIQAALGIDGNKKVKNQRKFENYSPMYQQQSGIAPFSSPGNCILIYFIICLIKISLSLHVK